MYTYTYICTYFYLRVRRGGVRVKFFRRHTEIYNRRTGRRRPKNRIKYNKNNAYRTPTVSGYNVILLYVYIYTTEGDKFREKKNIIQTDFSTGKRCGGCPTLFFCRVSPQPVNARLIKTKRTQKLLLCTVLLLLVYNFPGNTRKIKSFTTVDPNEI